MSVIKYTDEQKARILTAENIRKLQMVNQLTNKQMASCAGISEKTYLEKINRPTEKYFTQPELLRIFKRLNFSDFEILQSMKM